MSLNNMILLLQLSCSPVSRVVLVLITKPSSKQLLARNPPQVTLSISLHRRGRHRFLFPLSQSAPNAAPTPMKQLSLICPGSSFSLDQRLASAVIQIRNDSPEARLLHRLATSIDHGTLQVLRGVNNGGCCLE